MGQFLLSGVLAMKKKILVVDDSPFMLALVGDMLKKFDYDVATIDNGSDACKEVETTRFDMIITDLNMPVMDGLEFTRQVRTYPNCKFVPILMLSGENDQERITRAKTLGVSTFINKPPREAQLKSILQVILSKRSSLRVPVKLEVLYGEDQILSNYVAGYTHNMSVGGLFLETMNPLPLHEKLKIKFSLPEEDAPIVCKGRVAWTNSPVSPSDRTHPPGMGVEFVNFAEERQLKSFLMSGSWRN